MSSNFDFPVSAALSDESGRVSTPWAQWFQRVTAGVGSLYQSGTTANRPTTLLWVGRRYFDTTLGYPVWVRSVRPVVWVNASGVAV